jgi:hypothetical protein
MPRLVVAYVLSAGVFAIFATSAGAETSELERCLGASTILEAGGDVSDQELKAAQNACTDLMQSSADKKTLARVKAAAENIDDEVKRRGVAIR